jgi:hypothetical protein
MAQRLGIFICQSVKHAVEQAYAADETGVIELTLQEQAGKLEIRVRDYGLPENVAELEARLQQQAESGELPLMIGDVDELHWLEFGRDGKALQLIKWLPETHIAAQAGQPLAAFQDDVAVAPPQSYQVRRLQSAESAQVSRLMYQAYGNTYFNDDVYFPQRVAALNAQDVNLSFVAVGELGEVVGHYALERNQSGPVAEGGQAVIDPRHRSRGLLEQLKAQALQSAQELNLIGWYADAVSVHTFTQQSNARHGGHLTCVDLGIAPRTECFRHLAEHQPQRVTCLLYFHWLQTPQPRRVYLPERHSQVLRDIYSRLECPILEAAVPQQDSSL